VSRSVEAVEEAAAEALPAEALPAEARVAEARAVEAVRVVDEETMEMTPRAAVVARVAVAVRAVAGKVSAQECRDCSRRSVAA